MIKRMVKKSCEEQQQKEAIEKPEKLIEENGEDLEATLVDEPEDIQSPMSPPVESELAENDSEKDCKFNGFYEI